MQSWGQFCLFASVTKEDLFIQSVSVAVCQGSNSDITAVTWKLIHFHACMDTKGGNN